MENIKEFLSRKLVDSPFFKKGQRDFKEGKVKMPLQNYYWVSKLVSKRYFDTLDSRNYYYLGEDGIGKEKKVKIGFLSLNIPQDCEEIFDGEELRKIDLYRRVLNSRPYCFEEVI